MVASARPSRTRTCSGSARLPVSPRAVTTKFPGPDEKPSLIVLVFLVFALCPVSILGKIVQEFKELA